jgi:hypothetical protein
MARRTHLVGAWPGRGPEHAIEQALDRLAPHLDRCSDGETGDRHLWCTPIIEKLRANPDVEIVRDGDWSDYEHVAQWRVRDGVTMDPDNFRMHYELAFRNAYPSFRVLRERYGRPDLRFQVGIVAPIDVALYAFGDAAFADPSILEACQAATVREIAAIHAEAGDDVVFQLETVVALVAIAQAEDAAQEAVAAQMAGTMLDTVGRSPAGARFGMHLCLGDFHHTAYGNMRDARPIVLLANAIAAGFPSDRVLEFVHAPFAAAKEPPIADEAFYAPLADLRLPEDTRFIAGFLHETLDTDAHRELLARIERLARREVDVAAACGLGRRDSDDEAFAQMRETAALLETPMTTTGA